MIPRRIYFTHFILNFFNTICNIENVCLRVVWYLLLRNDFKLTIERRSYGSLQNLKLATISQTIHNRVSVIFSILIFCISFFSYPVNDLYKMSWLKYWLSKSGLRSLGKICFRFKISFASKHFYMYWYLFSES